MVRPAATEAPTTEPAEVPTIRSASESLMPSEAMPARIPHIHAIPVMPPPPRTSARRVIRRSFPVHMARPPKPIAVPAHRAIMPARARLGTRRRCRVPSRRHPLAPDLAEDELGGGVLVAVQVGQVYLGAEAAVAEGVV